MKQSLLKNLILVIFLTGCASASRNGNTKHNTNPAIIEQSASPENMHKIAQIDLDTLLQNIKPISLQDLPQSQHGEIILSEGFYEADFKSYCLQPGTPDPSARDAYLQAPLGGYRKDIVETVLRNSLDRPDLEQRNIQLLLWSVVSGSDYNRLSSSVKATSRQLLTSKQLFALQGGVMGMMWLATNYPIAFGIVLCIVLAVSVVLIVVLLRFLKAVLRRVSEFFSGDPRTA